jgi:hypothetical protein
MRLDEMLNQAYAQKPPVLEQKPMHRSIMDGAELITRRLYMPMSFNHAQMTLHRKLVILAKTNNKYTFSHTTCIEATLSVSRLQADLFEQCQLGRMLYADRWKILSLIQSEFLLATMILCFNLDDDMTNARRGMSLFERGLSKERNSASVFVSYTEATASHLQRSADGGESYQCCPHQSSEHSRHGYSERDDRIPTQRQPFLDLFNSHHPRY